jgi:hypothetical protein
VGDSVRPVLDPERVAAARARVAAKLDEATALRTEADQKESEARTLQRTWGISDE